MPYCLPREEANKIKQAIINGKLNPEKLNNMTSANRRAFLATLVGEFNAKQINLSFERKLLLKNQERAMSDWARDITGMSKEAKEATLAKIRQTYADKNRRLYEPEENEIFLNEIVSDIYSKKTGTDISLEEAQTITELGADVRINRAKVDVSGSKGDALEFGASKVAFDNYVGALKTEAQKRTLVNPFTQKGAQKIAALIENSKIATNFIFDNSRALRASYDNSFFGRQGIKVAWNPKYTKLWVKDFARSFIDIYKTLKGDIGRGMSAKDVALGKDSIRAGDALMDAEKARVYAEDNYLNGRFETAGKKGSKLDMGGAEEEIPTSAPSKIPILGRAFKAAEVAYEAGALRLRVAVANKLYKLAEKTEVDLTDNEVVGSINELANSMTGRGKVKLSDTSQKFLNKAIFSVKFAKSNYDILVSPLKLAADPTNFAKQQAAKNLLSIAATMGIYQMIRRGINPDSVEIDPRSSEWGTSIEGDTRKDITGGLRSYITLISRITPTLHNGEWGQWVKSSTTGKFTKLSTGFGGTSAIDLLEDFVENKASPAAGQIMELLEQSTFGGDKPSVGSVVRGLTVPLVIEEGIEASQNERSAGVLKTVILDGLGISTSTFSINTNWSRNPSKELERFKEKVGDSKFKQVNDEFNKNMRTWFATEQEKSSYEEMSDDDKSKLITRQRRIEKKNIFKKYWK